jgi:hypothetical protein
VRCPADDIVNPLNVFRIIANSELRKASEYYEAVQVKPQHVSLKLRISEFFSAPGLLFNLAFWKLAKLFGKECSRAKGWSVSQHEFRHGALW